MFAYLLSHIARAIEEDSYKELKKKSVGVMIMTQCSCKSPNLGICSEGGRARRRRNIRRESESPLLYISISFIALRLHKLKDI